MKYILSFVTILICLGGFAHGQAFEQPQAREQMTTRLDYATFKIGNYPEFALVEFYYLLLRKELTFEMLDDIYQAEAYIWLEIFDDKGKLIDTLYKKIATQVDEPQKTTQGNFKVLDALQALMRPGEYSVKLYVEDANSQVNGEPFSGKFAETQIKVQIPDYSSDKDLMMSDIELAYDIDMIPSEDTVSESGNPLEKGNRHVIPNPARVYYDSDSLMYFYAEIYNLKFGKDINRKYIVNFRIEDYAKTPVASYGQREYHKPGPSAIISSAIDVNDLPEGNFDFIIEVTDLEDNSNVTSRKSFTLLYSTDEIAPAVATEDFTEKDAELMKKIIYYYTKDQDRKLYEELDLEGKKNWLKEFWDRRDPIPSTRLNEFKVEVFRRFKHANDKFSISMIDRDDGWLTDRGRIYMKYGDPDEIENKVSTASRDPYERWNYFNFGSQGYIYFIFVDETGYGDYVLKHSTAQGERTDREWEQLIKNEDPFSPGY
ncbi:MAG: GWxTD domain-containing protein [candidate division Zixibacteria bacterium]|nr:GWxTD domain-containing protein [candidate division Zixibacteria bacterium]